MPPTIVFLHGFTQTAASWGPVIDRLGQRYRALALDLRGHGSAADERPVDFASCTADVARRGPGTFTLVGYSLGARLALVFALSHPERVERLVLVSGTAGIADDIERAERRAADERLALEIEQGAIEDFARRWGGQALFKGQPREVADAAYQDRLRNRPAGLAAALRGLGTGAMEPLWSRLGELRMPLTAIVGERDGKFRKLGERLLAGVPDGELVVVPAVCHAVQLEAPALVAALLRERVPATEAA